MKRFLAALTGPLLAAFLLTGCTSINEMLFGAAETPAQQAYQEKGKLVYVSIPIRNYVLLWLCRYALMTVVAVLAVILIAAVFWRYALNNAIPWSEELSKYLMVWLTFLGAPIALRHGSHINIDLLQQLMLCNGKVGLLAKRVGMERTHLYRKLRSLGVDFRQITED